MTINHAYAQKLVDKGLNEACTSVDLDALWRLATDAMRSSEPGSYAVAFGATEALLTQADAGRVFIDKLPDVRTTACAQGRSDELTQGLVDRIESYNWHVGRIGK